MTKVVLKIFFFFMAIIFLILGIAGVLLPILPGVVFLILGLSFLGIALNINRKKPYRLLVNRKDILNNEELHIKLTTLTTAITILFLMGVALFLKNYEFVYYILVLLPLFISTYFLRKRIKLHLPIFVLVSLLFIMHCAGGILSFGGVRLYDTYFWLIKYDNIMHFFGSFILVFVVYSLMFNRTKENLFVKLALIAMGVGTIVEIIEFIAVNFIGITGVGDYFNNALDLVMNTLGALLGALIVSGYNRKKEFKFFMKGKLS